MKKKQLDSFRKEGYLHVKGFYNRSHIRDVLNEAKAIFILQMHRLGIPTDFPLDDEVSLCEAMRKLFISDLEAFVNCGKQAQHLISLHRLSLDSSVELAVKSMGLEFPNISTRPVLFFNNPSLANKRVYHTVDSHQDWRSMQGSLDAVVLWCPLIDIDKSLGALEIVPGSHLRGLITESVESGFGMVPEHCFTENDWITAEVERGDALFFSSFLVHRSGNNITNRIRWSCHFRYNNLREPSFIDRKYHHNYLYKPVDELHTPDFPEPDAVKAIYSCESLSKKTHD
jgi:hypothetical protein